MQAFPPLDLNTQDLLARKAATDMPGRLPTPDDFPPSVTLAIVPPPGSQPPTNVLLLLHGLGDSNTNFAKLGQQLCLPETACIALQAPTGLPLGLDGFHWGDDLLFDQNTGEMDTDTGFRASTRLLLETVVRQGLCDKCGYRMREIIIFGYGQGGMLGLQTAVELDDGVELGGVVSIGGVLPLSLPVKALEKRSRTPALVCKASKGSVVTESAISRLKDAFEHVEVKEWTRNGDGMPSNREEMTAIMKFFARRLRSVRGVPAGSIELA